MDNSIIYYSGRRENTRSCGHTRAYERTYRLRAYGNKGYNYKTFTYNPYGDRPTAGISYPVGKAWGGSKEYVEGYQKLEKGRW
jgi:hypothetical protein